MKNVAIISFFVLLLSCHNTEKSTNVLLADNSQVVPAHLQVHPEKPTHKIKEPEPYAIHLKANAKEGNLYELNIRVTLSKGCYYVSPNSKRDFKGKFTLNWADTEMFKAQGELVETPKSVEVYDPHPFVDGYVNWVRQTTTYTQELRVNSETDFSVPGMIRFTIEPRCTLEEIPIIISLKDGKIQAEIDGC